MRRLFLVTCIACFAVVPLLWAEEGRLVDGETLVQSGGAWKLIDAGRGRLLETIRPEGEAGGGRAGFRIPAEIAASGPVLVAPAGDLESVTNVGVVARLSLEAENAGVDVELAVVLVNDEGVETVFDFGRLAGQGSGPRTYIWSNPRYIEEVRDMDMARESLYPPRSYGLRFQGFLVRRIAGTAGSAAGEIVLYVDGLDLAFDRRFLEIAPLPD